MAKINLTYAQRKALETAISNNGTLEIGGLDSDHVSRTVICNLYKKSLLACGTNNSTNNWIGIWKITDLGRQAAQAKDPAKRV